MLRVAVQEHPNHECQLSYGWRFSANFSFGFSARESGLVCAAKVINKIIESEIQDHQNLALGLGKEIVTDENLSYGELSSKIDELEKVIELVKYGRHTGAERLLVQQFVHHDWSHTVPAVAQAMWIVFKKGTFTIEVIWEAVKDHVHALIWSGGADTYKAFPKKEAMYAVASFFGKGEQVCQKVQAFMTIVSTETDEQQKRGQKRQFTVEEKQQYIKKFHEQNRALQAQLKTGIAKILRRTRTLT